MAVSRCCPATSGSAATRASAGRTPLRLKATITATATTTLMTTIGSRSIATVGPPSQKNGTANQACTPSM